MDNLFSLLLLSLLGTPPSNSQRWPMPRKQAAVLSVLRKTECWGFLLRISLVPYWQNTRIMGKTPHKENQLLATPSVSTFHSFFYSQKGKIAVKIYYVHRGLTGKHKQRWAYKDSTVHLRKKNPWSIRNKRGNEMKFYKIYKWRQCLHREVQENFVFIKNSNRGLAGVA